MNSIVKNYSTRRQMRTMVVLVVYQYELFDLKVNVNKVFEDDLFHDLFDYEEFESQKKNLIYEEQMKIISSIEKNYDLLKKLIAKYIREDWIWNRIDPLIRAILLVACIELWKLDLGIVSNEYVAISKDFIPDDKSYKFINKMIDNIGREYEQYKTKRNQESVKKSK